ncbi:MAG: hypothetical protein WDO68_04325 [Gammaproteobacteria bacterium]
MSGVFHFGEKDDSPFALRQLAAAFLNEAHAFGGQQRRLSDEEVANHRLAQQKLAGVGNVFTCANDLAVDIKNPLWEQANSDPQLMEIYRALIPAGLVSQPPRGNFRRVRVTERHGYLLRGVSV